jgi:hypothetical protein
MKCTNRTGYFSEYCDIDLIDHRDTNGEPVELLLFPNLVVDVFICPSCGKLYFFKNDEETLKVSEKDLRLKETS